MEEKAKIEEKVKVEEKVKNIRVIPLGGLGEVGKNITAIEFGEEIVVIDCGMTFPDTDMYGIDIVIPDVSYLVENKHRVKGFFITHGHEDHIGGLPYILKQVNAPVYGTKLTIGLITSKLEEHNLLDVCSLNVVTPGEMVTVDKVKVEFIRTNHSIADSCSIAVHTPLGVILHTGDFKVDFTPIDKNIINLQRYAELGKRGVLLLMADSTNALTPGYTMSESRVGETLDNLFRKGNGRIIVATFASNIHRLQQIIDSSFKYGRKVAFSGRSMEKISEVARELGYLNVPDGLIIELNDIKLYKNNEVTIVTTGSQGEPMSALTRIASGTHRSISVEPDDMIIISATPIPGNQKAVSKVINDLTMKGADVVYKSIEAIHVSGHACQEELKLIQSIVKPKFFMPVHGEEKHLLHHRKIAEDLGMKSTNVFTLDNGNILTLNRRKARISGSVQAGRVLVDGLGVGDVGNVVIRDRKFLAQDGIINIIFVMDKASHSILAGPDVVSRGFVYVRESEGLMKDITDVARESIDKCITSHIYQWSKIKNEMRSAVGSFIYEKTKRRPMIVPIIMEAEH